MDNTSATLQAFGHVDRLRILLSMEDRGRTVSQIGAELGMPPAMVLKHVRMLCKAGVVKNALPGGSPCYRLAPVAVDVLRRMAGTAT